MAMLIELSDRAAARVAAAAAARGISPGEIVEELIVTLETHPSTGVDPDAGDPLQAFLGCGASGDRRPRSIRELREELSAAQLEPRR